MRSTALEKDVTLSSCNGVCPSSTLIIQALSLSTENIYAETTHVPSNAEKFQILLF